jgi:TfoX/Sxy family transcriptional regulator of competence genes
MAYDELLAGRVRDALARDGEVASERRMFGGLAFLVHGHLAVSASSRGGLLVRIDPADVETLTRSPHVRRFEMRGREMDGWLHVEAAAAATDDELRRWVGIGLRHARSLPPEPESS